MQGGDSQHNVIVYPMLPQNRGKEGGEEGEGGGDPYNLNWEGGVNNGREKGDTRKEGKKGGESVLSFYNSERKEKEKKKGGGIQEKERKRREGGGRREEIVM